jgi:hypothetical protein
VRLWCANALEECWENTREACITLGYGPFLHASLVFSQHSPSALSHHKRTRLVFYFLINIIIQLTPHWGFSVTDDIKYYTYLAMLLTVLRLDYLSLQQM